MNDVSRILALIQDCTDAEKLRSWMTNARKNNRAEVEDAAFRRLIAILPKEAPGTLEHDFWRTVYAFEHALSEERGRTTRLARTRQKVARVGETQTLQDWALDSRPTDGFSMLLERNMPELTGEAIVLRHADKFGPDVVAAARRKLEQHKIDIESVIKR